MDTLLSSLRVIHIVTAILMAWPFYALVAVNQRARIGPPLGDRVDTFLEDTVKNRSIPCLVFQATALVSGLLLLFLRGFSVSYLISNPVLVAKLALLFLIAGLLSYVMLVTQPKLDALFAALASPGASPDLPAKIAPLRLRRKRMASVCLFGVLSAAMLGLQVWLPFPAYLTLLFLLAIAVFVWRAYSSVIPYGWV
jgi:hypothetical protein